MWLPISQSRRNNFFWHFPIELQHMKQTEKSSSFTGTTFSIAIESSFGPLTANNSQGEHFCRFSKLTSKAGCLRAFVLAATDQFSDKARSE